MCEPLPSAVPLRRRSRLFAVVLTVATVWLSSACSAPPHVEVRSQRIALRTGIELAYLDRGPADGEAVVLLHGYTDSSFSFSRMLPHLPAGWRVVVPDLRGHGASSKDAPTCTMLDLAADVVAFLDALGIERATLVGHSMGSLVAQIVASDHPRRVRGLVLIGSMVRGGNEATLGLLEEVSAMRGAVDEAFVRDFQQACLAGPVPDDFFAAVVEHGTTVRHDTWRRALADFVLQDTSARLGAIGAPTLIVWGAEDAFSSRDEQDELAGRIRGAELRVLPAVGHCPNWEQPALVAGLLVDFVAAAPSPPHPIR